MTNAGALTVAAAQPECVSHDVAVNAMAHSDVIRAADARVVAFPELSLTGYELDALPVDPSDERLLPMIDACALTRSVALAGAPTSDDRGDHISTIAVDGAGARVLYRKMWLSDREAQRFVPGSSPAVVEVDGWRLGLAICKDTGIPAHADVTATLGMDAYVAGVLDSADHASVQDERAHRVASRHHGLSLRASLVRQAAGTTSRPHSHASGRRMGSPLPAPGGMSEGLRVQPWSRDIHRQLPEPNRMVVAWRSRTSPNAGVCVPALPGAFVT